MSLLEQWRATAYSQEMDKTQLQKFLDDIFFRLREESMSSFSLIQMRKSEEL